ncbi:hypothetical protein PMIN03_000040 [Paraphaeosphaeria minitans]
MCKILKASMGNFATDEILNMILVRVPPVTVKTYIGYGMPASCGCARLDADVPIDTQATTPTPFTLRHLRLDRNVFASTQKQALPLRSARYKIAVPARPATGSPQKQAADQRAPLGD